MGNRVPSSTVAAATTNRMLLPNSSSSRDSTPKPCWDGSVRNNGARSAYNSNAPPTNTAKMSRMNTPRPGSLAKACTEVNSPERVIKVPSRLPAKARIASSTVQPLNTPRFSATARE